MNSLPLQPLVWSRALTAQSAFHQYLVRKDDEATKRSKSQYVVNYGRLNAQKSMNIATGFATIDEAKAWAWNHYNEKMAPWVKPDSISDIKAWFKAAKPEPTDKDRLTQIGCHYEEVSEMMVACHGSEHLASKTVDNCARGYKRFLEEMAFSAQPHDHIELLDALCDQIVTATGVAYMMGFDIEGALKEVIRSNNSKMVNGKFIFDENGKIMKAEGYSKPDLTPFVK